MEILILIAKSMVLPLGFVFLYLAQRQRTKHPACGCCGYNLTGRPAESMDCPECGGAIATVGIKPAGTVQRNPWLHSAGLLIIIPTLILPFFVVLLILLLALAFRLMGWPW